MSKRKGKRKKSGATKKPDHDTQLLHAFLKEVEGYLWTLSQADKEKALKDLKKHIVAKSKIWNVDNAMEMALYSVGSPEVLAKGLNTLYGYGTWFKAFLITLCILVALPTVPIFGAWAVISLMVLFLMVTNFGTKAGIVTGGLMGLGAVISRSIFAFLFVLTNPSEFTIGTNQAIIDFVLVSMFIVLVALLAGHIRESSMRSFLKKESA